MSQESELSLSLNSGPAKLERESPRDTHDIPEQQKNEDFVPDANVQPNS